MNAPRPPVKPRNIYVGGPDCAHWYRQWLPGPPGTSIKLPCAEMLCDEAGPAGVLHLAGRKFYRTTKYDPKRVVWEEMK